MMNSMTDLWLICFRAEIVRDEDLAIYDKRDPFGIDFHELSSSVDLEVLGHLLVP